MLNPVPVAVACEIVTLDPPVFVSESVKVTLLPVWALPKARLAGLAVSWPGAVPVPESETFTVELEALDTTVMPPLTLAADCGANTALKGTLAPGLRTNGTLSPLMLNPVPVAVACEIVTPDAPVFVSEPAKVTLLPTWALPKDRLAGLAESWPGAVGAAGAVPVPVRGMASAGPETSRLPPTVPADRGVKVTFNLTLCPTPRVNGTAGPLIENPLPDVWSENSVTCQERAFVSTTGTVDVVPVATWPNDTIEGLAVKASAFSPEPPTLRLAIDALPKNLIVLPVHPIVLGAKVTLRSTLCPADKTSGRLKDDVVNSELPTAIPETVALVCPVFATVTSKVSL
jgi:hypothetical protein